MLINYYDELEIDQSLSCEEIDQTLKQLRRKWRSRMNAAALEDRQRAERMSALIEEAAPILTNPTARCNYENELVNQSAQSSAQTTSVPTTNYDVPLDLDEQIEILLREHNWAEINRLTRNAVKSNNATDDVQYYYFYSSAILNDDDPNKAYEYFHKALEIRPGDDDAKYWVAVMSYCLDKYDEASSLFAELLQRGYADNDSVSKGLYRCYFAMDREPMAYEIITGYIRRNPNDAVYKRDAQKAYFDEITKLFGDRDRPESIEQLNIMLDYARKADSILSNGRSREKLEFLEKASKHGINYEEKRRPQRESLLTRLLNFFE